MEKLLTERQRWKQYTHTHNDEKKIIQSKSIKGANVHISSIFPQTTTLIFLFGQLVGFLFNFHNCYRLNLSSAPQPHYLPKANQFTFHGVHIAHDASIGKASLIFVSYKMSHQKQYTKLQKDNIIPSNTKWSGCDEIENIIMFALLIS